MTNSLIPSTLRYTKDHEWTKSEGDIATIGITHYAQQQLGDVVYLELPEPGTNISQGKVFATVESVKAVSDIFAPINGEIIAINQDLIHNPEIINQDPYGQGWLVQVKIALDGGARDLLDANEYAKYLKEHHK